MLGLPVAEDVVGGEGSSLLGGEDGLVLTIAGVVGEVYNIRSWSSHVALGIGGVVLLEAVGGNVHTCGGPTACSKRVVEHLGVDPVAGRFATPRTCEGELLAFALDGAVEEYIAIVLACIGRSGAVGCCNDVVAITWIDAAALVDEGYTVIDHVAIAAEVIDGAVNLGILPVAVACAVAVVGVLVREHADVLLDGVGTLVLQADGTTCAARLVVFEGILDGEVLQIEVVGSVEQGSGGADALVLDSGSVDEDGALHRFADDRDVVARDLGQYEFAEVILAVGQEDLGIAGSIGRSQGNEEAVGIVGRDAVVAGSFVVLYEVNHVIDGHLVDVGSAAEGDGEDVGLVTVVLESGFSAIVLDLYGEGGNGLASLVGDGSLGAFSRIAAVADADDGLAGYGDGEAVACTERPAVL